VNIEQGSILYLEDKNVLIDEIILRLFLNYDTINSSHL